MLNKSTNKTNKHLFKTVFLSGLLVGTLDILAAFTDYYIATGKSPSGVLNYIASGIFGKYAFTGNRGMIFLGLLFHYVFAFAFTIFFFWTYSRMSLLSKNRIVTGFIYGLFAWMIMNLIVIRLSNAPYGPINSINIVKALKAVLILVFMMGLPLSFIAYKIFVTDYKKTTTI